MLFIIILAFIASVKVYPAAAPSIPMSDNGHLISCTGLPLQPVSVRHGGAPVAQRDGLIHPDRLACQADEAKTPTHYGEIDLQDLDCSRDLTQQTDSDSLNALFRDILRMNRNDIFALIDLPLLVATKDNNFDQDEAKQNALLLVFEGRLNALLAQEVAAALFYDAHLRKSVAKKLTIPSIYYLRDVGNDAEILQYQNFLNYLIQVPVTGLDYKLRKGCIVFLPATEELNAEKIGGLKGVVIRHKFRKNLSFKSALLLAQALSYTSEIIDLRVGLFTKAEAREQSYMLEQAYFKEQRSLLRRCNEEQRLIVNDQMLIIMQQKIIELSREEKNRREGIAREQESVRNDLVQKEKKTRLFALQYAQRASKRDPFACTICQNFEDQDDNLGLIFILSCGHGICISCFGQAIDVALQDNSTETLCCPAADCQNERSNTRRMFSSDDVETFIMLDSDKTEPQTITPKERLDKLRYVQLHAYLQSIKNVKACPTPNCAQRFINEDGSIFMMRCSSCKQQYCSNCLIPHDHRVMNCQEARRVNQGTVTKYSAEARPCPRCKEPIIKADGCKFINCQHCSTKEPQYKHDFCWVCGFLCDPSDPKSRRHQAHTCFLKSTFPTTTEYEEASRIHRWWEQYEEGHSKPAAQAAAAAPPS